MPRILKNRGAKAVTRHKLVYTPVHHAATIEWDKYTRQPAEFAELVGRTIGCISVSNDSEELLIEMVDGTLYAMYHEQDCCESVRFQDCDMDFDDLRSAEVFEAEEATSQDDTEESATWTFYKLRTDKGYATIRWHGSSNGYYSESVDFVKLVLNGA